MSLKAKMDAVYKRKVEQELEKSVRVTGLQVMTNIVLNTPVDTGRARSNWNVDLNTVDATITNAADPGTDGSAKFLEATLSYKLADAVYISNNLPYIRRLNDGYSKQAPANFVDKAVMVGTRQAKQIIKREAAK